MECDDQTYSLDALLLLLLFFGCRRYYGGCGLRNLGSHEKTSSGVDVEMGNFAAEIDWQWQ